MSQKPVSSNLEQAFLPFARPSITDDEIHEVVDSLKSGWITTGPKVQKFEEQLRDYCQAPYALTVSSGTAGLLLALKTLDLQPGDEVITTAFTFVATANTIVHAGAKPVFVDIDPRTFNIDIERVEKAITPRTKAIVPVHFSGVPVDLDRIYALARHYNLTIIEDCAHAIGTKYKGKTLGSFGHFQVFSFHPNKNMTTGEGGCIVLHDHDQAKKIKALRFHGIDRDAWNRFAKSGSQEYDVIAPGYKFNMMDLQAAIGIHQIQKLDDMIAKRTTLALRYREKLKGVTCFENQKDPQFSMTHSWHLYLVKLNADLAGCDRNQFMRKMKERNIGLGLHYQAVPTFSYYQKEFGYRPGQFPIAEDLGRNVVSLPLFPDMTFAEQDRVITAINDILG